MERVISQDERIRRAQEAYIKRKMQTGDNRSATVNVDKVKSNKITKKLIQQFVICLIIYGVFYTIKCTPNLVSEEIMYKISDILEYDINVQELYHTIINKTQEQNDTKESNNLVEDTLSATDSIIDIDNEINLNNEIEEQENIIQEEIEQSSSLSQMEIDAEFIKANYKIIKPLEGEITSRYGLRNPTVATVPKYHTGIDIARVVGTVIIAAMDGNVELVSTEGDLRKSYKNNKWRSIDRICTL